MINPGHWSLSPSKRAVCSDDAGKRWPADYLVQDIVRFFGDCSEHLQEKLHTVFHCHFQTVPFHCSTYYDNVKRWKRAKQAVRDGVMGDKWSVFIRGHIRNRLGCLVSSLICIYVTPFALLINNVVPK
jgi:hypothetical protein